MRIVIANDHTALDLKDELTKHLLNRGEQVTDLGTDEKGTTEYPVYAERAAAAVAAGEYDAGLLLCGTGVGMSLAANKVRGIRAAACSEPYTAKLSREHNHTNILCLGARVVGVEMAKMIVDAWLDAPCMGGRHQTRVDMIMAIEQRTIAGGAAS